MNKWKINFIFLLFESYEFYRGVVNTMAYYYKGNRKGCEDICCQFFIGFYIIKKSNATQIWSIIFPLSWIFIHQVWYPWKACLFAFRLVPYLLGLFHWGACRVNKLGAMSKRKSCKIYWIMSAWSTHCPFIAPKSSNTFGGFRCNEWAVGTHAYTHKRKAQNLT